MAEVPPPVTAVGGEVDGAVLGHAGAAVACGMISQDHDGARRQEPSRCPAAATAPPPSRSTVTPCAAAPARDRGGEPSQLLIGFAAGRG